MRSVIVTAGLACVLAAACARDPEARRQEYLRRAADHVERGSHAEAVIAYRNALQLKPADAATQRLLAEAYSKAGQPIEALRARLAAADLEPANLEAQREAAWILLGAGDYAGALERARRLLDRDGTDADALLLQAYAVGRTKGPKAGLDAVQDLLAREPGNGPALALAGSLQLELGQLGSSREALARAAALAPTSADVHVALGTAEWAAGRTAAAERALRRAVAIAPASEGSNRALALFLMGEQRTAEAEVYARAAQRAAPDRGGLLLASWYRAAGRPDAERRLLEQLAAGERPPGAATVQLAALEAMAGRHERALEQLSRANRKAPRAEWLLLEARVLIAANRPADAAASLDRALDIDPDAAGLLVWRALVARQLGEHERAERWLDRAAALAPPSSAVAEHRASLAIERGDVRRALALAGEGLARDPGATGLRILRARAERLSGDARAAAATLAPVLRGDSVPPQAQLEWGHLLAARHEWAGAARAFDSALADAASRPEAIAGIVAAGIGAGRESAAAERLARLDREHAEVDVEIAIAEGYLRLSLPERAEAVARQAIATRQPATGTAAALYTVAGLSLEARGRTDEARDAYRQALEMDGAHGVAAGNLAWLELQRGNADAAHRWATVARRSLGDAPPVLHTLGLAYVRRGQHDLAIEALRASALAAPDRARYRLDWVDALLAAGRAEQALGVLRPLRREALDTADGARAGDLERRARAAIEGARPPA